MSNVTTVTISSGIPVAGSGLVSTIDNMLGVAGTPNSNVLTMQGVTSGIPVAVSGTSVVKLTLNDSISTVIGLGVTNPNNITFLTSLTMSTTTAFTVTPSATSTTMLFSAQGYKGA